MYVAPTPGAYGFARFLDIFTNLTASTQIVPIRIHTNLGLDNAGTYWQTSSGDSTYTTADYWVVTDDAQGVGVADPVVTQVYGDGTFPPTSATQTAVDNYETYFDITVPASGTVIFMHFAAQRWNISEGLTLGPELAGLASYTTVGMSATELSQVVNFNAPSNATPVADSQSVTTGEDTSLAVTLTASDADGDALTYTLVSSPASGGLTGTLPSVTYNPNTDFYGSDSFSFYVNDGTVNSSTATVSITVNGTPVPTAQDFTMLTNSVTDAVLAAEDPEGDTITYSVTSTPVSGVLTGVVPDLTYTPDTDFTGAISFTFTASDAYTTSAVTTIDIAVVDPVVLSGVDLMVNGGFETGDTTSWTVVDDDWAGNSGESAASPIEGSYFIDAATASAELMQVIDVSGYASQITAGTMTFGLSAYARSKSEAKPDGARVIIEHRASNNSTVL
ncbi:MAG: Ig-like domain-containing protein [Candidatus Poribacteria bacterium]